MDKLTQHLAQLTPEQRKKLQQRLGLTQQPTIPHRLTNQPLPLSFTQKRLWFLTQFEPTSPAYHIGNAVRVTIPLQIEGVRQALAAIANRHEILRTGIQVVDGQPVQVIRELLVLPLTQIDLRSHPDPEAEYQRQLVQISQQLFDLEQGSLWRMTLFQLAEAELILLLSIHHLIWDGSSLQIFWHEFSSFYQAFLNQQASPLPPLPIQYGDFALWQQQQFQAGHLQTQFDYWKRQLKGSQMVLELPCDRPRPPRQTFAGKRHFLTVPKRVVDELKSLSQSTETTLFMILLTAFNILLYRYTKQEDILVGTPIANRRQMETEGLIGFFANTLVLRTNLSGNPTFRSLLQQVRQTALDAYTHQDFPFEKLVAELQPQRDLSHSPLIQVMFAFQNVPLPAVEIGDRVFIPSRQDIGVTGFELTLDVREIAGEFQGHIEYNTDLFEPTTIERMVGHWLNLLAGIVANPDRSIGELSLLSPAERHQLLVEWNNTQTEYPQDKCIHQLFEEQVERTPDAVALVFEDQQLTYRELNHRANQLGHYLQKLGVRADVLVGICVERSLEMVVGLLGILKAGGGYVPLDPTYPQERLTFMVEDTRCAAILTQNRWVKSLPVGEIPIVCIDTNWSEIAQSSPENLTTPITANNLAYVLYTSGSTGTPKGVAVPHQGVVRLVKNTNYINVTTEDVFLQFAPLAFDASTFEIWGCLLNSAKLIIPPSHTLLLTELGQLIKKHQITILWLTASLFHLMVNEELEQLKSVKQLLAGGDVLAVPQVLKVLNNLEDCRLINGYGPTENTTFTCIYAMTDTSQVGASVSIGRPIANTQVYILDGQLQPVPIGVSGELYIGGDGLARGYLNRPQLDREKFIPHPFKQGDSQSRLYKSGDLARYLPDGNIEFLGRIDNQVKIRGFRIELGEIEAVLAQVASVRETVVIAREDLPGDKRLVAYIVAQEPEPIIDELRRLLKQKLPDYMVPSAFVLLEALPLTPNGKVDRHALPAPDISKESFAEKFVAPRTSTEEIIANIWAEVLRLARVGIHNNFFELGGNSLLATQVISRLQKAFSLEMPLRMLFETPTVAGLSQSLAKVQTGTTGNLPLLVPVSRSGKLPLSFTQTKLWFFDQLSPNSATYNIPYAYRLKGILNVAVLEQSLAEIIRRHESLRTIFTSVDGEPLQIIAESINFTLPVIDLEEISAAAREAEAKRLITEESQVPFNLAISPLFRAKLLRMAPDDWILLVTLHHIIFDGWSEGIFRRELAVLYEAFSSGKPSPLPKLPIHYADYAVWQREWWQGEFLASQLSYWKQQLGGNLPILQLPTDYPRPPIQTYSGKQQYLLLSPELSSEIKELSRSSGVTLFMTLLAAFYTLLYRYSGQSDIIIGTPIAGRNQVEIEELIGFFVNTLALRINLEENPSFRELLERVREVTLGAYAHQNLPFEKLVEELQPNRDLSHSPLFQVMFGLQNTPDSALELSGLSIENFPIDNGTVKFDLTLAMREAPEGILGIWRYRTDLFKEATMTRMLGHFQNLLEGIVANPEQPIGTLPLLTGIDRTALTIWTNQSDQSQNPQQFSCYLIGHESLVIPCAEVLIKGGHKILGIISTGISIAQWTTSQSIPHIKSTENLIYFLSQEPFDYLFSIYNISILPPEIIRLPRRFAINCHDALLPKYGGINAPSWAILHDEKNHGITWHQMTNLVDGGDIFKQIAIKIDPDETAFTLNSKCYEAAIHSFTQLIDELACNRVVLTQQNLDERSYFLLSQKPSPGCVLSWHQPANQIDAFMRALDFGYYQNWLGIPKLVIGNKFIIISKIAVLDEPSQSPAGTIITIDSNYLRIATTSYDILLKQLLTIDGKELSISEFIREFKLQIGDRLPEIDLNLAQQIKNWEALLVKHEKFWVERLATLQPIALPYAERKVLSASSAGEAKSQEWLIPSEVITCLKNRPAEWTLANFLVAAFAAYLVRISQTCCFDLRLRQLELPSQLAGFFAGDVPCRININYQQSFEEVFQAVNQELKLVKQHKTYARDVVVRYPALKGLRELGGQQELLVKIEQVQNLDDYTARLDSTLTLVVPAEGITCSWVYDPEIFDSDRIAGMQAQFTTFVRSIAADPTLALAQLELLSDDERYQVLVEWNNHEIYYPPNQCIQDLFELQVARTPDGVAVVFAEQQLSYRELQERANQLAHYLQNLGVKPEVLVGICLERSLEMLVGIWGILKAGGVYVPLDPAYPTERLNYIISDGQISLLLTQEKFQAQFGDRELNLVCWERDWSRIDRESRENPVTTVTSENLAYVIYTSGSTGKPKGVAISHKSLVNFTYAAIYEYEMSQRDRVLQFASISFDAAAEEIYPCLATGGTLVLRTDEILSSTIATFLKACQNWHLSVLDLPTAYWHQLVAELTTTDRRLPECLRLVIIGGERVLPESVQIWQKYIGNYPKLVNSYGPTEGTVVATTYPVTTATQINKEVPIGRAIANVKTYILDQNLQPVPIGMPGELHIGGAGLARGYLNRPELTQEKFITNPFSQEANAYLYKTGDLVRYLADGNIQFLGRIDNQVKIRGFRIELGEIESILLQHPDVREAVVIAREDIPTDKRLVAYVLTNQPATTNELRQFIQQKLPEYMVPSAFVFLEAFPLTPNGKIDRRSLPAPELSRPDQSVKYVAPRTPTEEILADIWIQVLKLEEVGIYDNFFELGGHSLLATQVISRIQKALGVELPLRSLFEAPTVAELAQCVETVLWAVGALPSDSSQTTIDYEEGEL
ncbi:MAG TPA: hypothetical protein DDZ80_13165 [Cyanobacteria bacterium UBA8803]|nr:hypothetical protein [Cyanobacteria bacterium UBA9273]HBL59421.1 hypothetical protein [Cyanobacteria bacterium UBA8803]